MIQEFKPYIYSWLFVATGILPFLSFWTMNDGKKFYVYQVYVILYGLSTALTVWSIVSYNKRQNQFVIGRLNIILNLILLGLFVYRSLNLSGDKCVSEKGIGMFLPIAAIVLLVLANKAIKKDEDLVKSVDRLR
jgi:small-conductance mechanosensitive channel